MKIVDGLMAWWAARPVLAALPVAVHEAGEMVVEVLHDRLVLAVQGEGHVELEGYDGGWSPLATVGAWSGAYVGVGMPTPVVPGAFVRLRWSTGRFGMTLAALPAAHRTRQG